MLLRHGKKVDGAKYSPAELGAIQKSVASSKANLIQHLDAAIAHGANADEPASLASRMMPGFYSQLQRAIESKMPAKANAPQIMGILNNPQNGVKQDEVKWSGLEPWLMKQGQVTKQQVLDYLKANEVRVEEVLHGPRDTAKHDQLIADLKSQLEAAKAKAIATETVKEGDRVATVGSAPSRSGYSYSTGKVYEAKRNAAGYLVWKKLVEFGGTRSGRSDRFILELKAQTEYPWKDNVTAFSPVQQGGIDPKLAFEIARLDAELKKEERPSASVKYKTEWQLPGGKNKRELIDRKS